MDAKKTPLALGVCALLIVGGCALNTQQPNAHHKRETTAEEQPTRDEAPQIVEQSADEPAPAAPTENIALTIEEFIQRVDEARTRARPAPLDTDSVPFRTAIDEEPIGDPVPVTTAPASQPTAPDEAAVPTDAEDPNKAIDPLPDDNPGEAPVLGEVTVRAAPALNVHPVDPRRPAVNSATAADYVAPLTLSDFLDQVPAAPDATFREQLDRRLLCVLAGQYDEARAPLELVTAEQQELAARFVEALIVIRAGHIGDPSGAATAAARELAVLQDALRQVSDLSIDNLVLCSTVYSFGQYDAIEPPRFLAGRANEFVLYCEVGDFVSEVEADGQYRSVFDLTTTILNRAGDVVVELKDPQIVDRCRNRRHDCFIPRLVRLPESLSPGRYVAKITIADTLGQKVAEDRATFELTARP